MKVKPKKCKGNYRTSLEGCGKLVYKRTYGLCDSCYAEWLLTTKDGQKKLKDATLKATKDRRELEKAEKEIKDSKRISYLLTNVKNIVHKYIRLRDKGKTCISCGVNWREDFQAGHFYKSELYSSLRFDEDNIHAQCPKCNMYDEGNLNKYDLRLPKRIGEAKYNKLKERAADDKKIAFKWDREELEEIRKDFKAKLKKLGD